jgi:hypothetical protein
MNRLVFWGLVVPAAAVAVVLLLAFGAVVLAVAPPVASLAALGILALAAAWFFLARRKSAGVLSEASLMGRQTSKDGLL